MKWLYPMTAAVMLLASAQAQLRTENLKAMEEDGPDAAAVKGYQSQVEKQYRDGGLVIAHFGPWWVLDFESLRKLFPGRRFYAGSWREGPAAGKEGKALGLGGGELTLVCNAGGKAPKEVFHSGDYEPFGEMLRDAKVSLRGQEDADRIWQAFCDLHQRHWQDQPAHKVNERVWHLGNKTSGQIHYFYEVKLDAEGVVSGAELKSETVASPEPASLKPLESVDPAYAAVKEWRAKLEQTHREAGGVMVPVYGSVQALESPALKGLFPNRRFIVCEWSQAAAAGKEKEAVGKALGIGVTLVCNAGGGLVGEILHGGEYQRFGEMLWDQKTNLVGQKGAERVWQAFCDLHQRPWEKRPSVMVDDKTWHLGDATIDQVHYFYEVELGEHDVVTGGEWKREPVGQGK